MCDLMYEGSLHEMLAIDGPGIACVYDPPVVHNGNAIAHGEELLEV